MTEPGPRPEDALAHIVRELRGLKKRFALVGGLAVSIRGEVRTTRDVDLAIAIQDDEEFETLSANLAGAGYHPVATVEQEEQCRRAMVRFTSPTEFLVDLLGASSGIEPEIVGAATPVDFEVAGAVPVATAEDLLAMKLLSARVGRATDWHDARGLLQVNPELDLSLVRARLRLIESRGFARKQDLLSKLDAFLAEVRSSS